MAETLLREAMDRAQIPRGRELTPAGVAPGARLPLIAVLGVGDLGLAVALGLQRAGQEVIGIDPGHRRELARLAAADAVLICVPAADGEHGPPDPAALRAACAAVCRHARRGQTIVLCAPAYVGATRELLARPLTELGFELGADLCVACAPWPVAAVAAGGAPAATPRLLGAGGRLCAEKARAVIAPIAPAPLIVASPEAAELLELGERA